MPSQTLEEHISERYAELSGQQRKAADFVLSNPVDVASRDLRSLAQTAQVSPATFSRLAVALGYDNFKAVKDLAREALEQKIPSFAQKAEDLRAVNKSGLHFLAQQSDACIENIQQLSRKTDPEKLKAAADTLAEANRVLLFGALGSTGIVEYLAYLARFFAPHWSLAGRMGASIGAATTGLQAGDAVLVVTKTPYAARAVAVARVAREAGANVILITDFHRCPALAHAKHAFIVPSETPQFFSSYAATLVLLEALIATIVATAKVDVAASIRRVEAHNQLLGEYWAP